MPKLQEVIDRKLKKRYFITVPAELVASKEWKKGQKLAFRWNERGNLEIEQIN